LKRANIVGAVIGMGFSAFAFIATLGFKKFRNVPVGPEFFPRWMAIGLFICSAALLIQALRVKQGADKPAPTISLRDKGMQRLLIGAAIVVVYAICWNILGFVIATPLAAFAIIFLLGYRKFPVMIIFSCAAAAIVYSAFHFFLGVDMPMGVLEGLF
jgi:putative tricarboxylic transport membrane protein